LELDYCPHWKCGCQRVCDNKVVKVVEEIKKTRAKVLRNNEWQIENKLVLKEGKVYVLKDESLRLEIIWLHHDMPIAGHEE